MIIVGGRNSRTGEFVSEVECFCPSKMAILFIWPFYNLNIFQGKMAWIDEFEPLPVPVVGMVGVVLPPM